MKTVELLNGIKHGDEIIEEESMSEYNLIYLDSINEEFKYDECYYFYNEHALVMINQKYGLINKHGKEILPCEFDNISEVVNDCIVAIKDGSEYFYDLDGDLVTEKEYIDCHPFSSKRGGFRDPETLLCGFIDEFGEEVIKAQYQEVEPFFNNYAPALSQDNLKYGMIDINGNLVIEHKYAETRVLNDGLIAVKDINTNKWGYIDIEDNLVIPYLYDYATTFESGKAVVKYRQEYYIINKNNKILKTYVDGINEEVKEDFVLNSKSIYEYEYNDKIIYMQSNAKDIPSNNPFYISVNSFGKFAIKNQNQTFTTDYIFDELSEQVHEGVLICVNGNKQTHINKDGKFLGLKEKIVYKDQNKIQVSNRYYGLRLLDDKDDNLWFQTEEEREHFLMRNPSYKTINFEKTLKLN